MNRFINTKVFKKGDTSYFKNILIAAILFFLTLLVVGKDLDKPFYGIHDWNGARYASIARNYLRYGVFTLGFSQVENGGVGEEESFKFYTHYPPLLPLLISVSFNIFGVSEVATRLVPLIASVGTIVAIYFIGRTILSEGVGISASLLALATPMIRYFGKNPVHEPLALFFVSISILGAILVTKEKRDGLFLVFMGLTASVLTNWLGVFLLIALTIILDSKTRRVHIALFWLWGLFLYCLHFIIVKAATGSFLGGGLLEAFLQRTTLGGTAELSSFTLIEFINRLRLWGSTLLTFSLIITSLLGVYLLVKQKNRKMNKLFFALFIVGVGQVLTFSNATYIHSYFIYPITLFTVLISAYGINALAKKAKTHVFIVFILVFVAVWFERAPYLTQLNISDNDKIAVKIGRDLKTKTKIEDSILIKPFSFAASRMPHLMFYSDRNIVLTSDSEYNWEVEVSEKDGTYEILSTER